MDVIPVEDGLVRSESWSSRGPDYSDSYRQQAQQLARQFAIMEGVVGVLLSGGLTFGEADRYSDIDLTVYLRQQSLRTWYFGEAPLPEGKSRYRDLRLNVSYLDYELERDRQWTSAEVWRASRAAVLYDPEGLIGELLDSKRPDDAQLRDEARELAADIRFTLDHAVPAWLYRGEVLAAHTLLNQALSQLIQMIHLTNGSPAPESGWDVVLLRSTGDLPDDIVERLQEALRTGDLTAADVSRRRYVVSTLLRETAAPPAPEQGSASRGEAESPLQGMLRHLLRHEPIEIDEFLAGFDRRLLIQSPAFELVWVDRQPDETLIRFNHERLGHIARHELGRFLDSQQRIIRELAAIASDENDS